MRARELLRGLFEGGRIVMTPQPDGSYVASCSFLPLVAIADAAPRARRGITAIKPSSLVNVTAAVSTPLEITMPKRADARKKTLR